MGGPQPGAGDRSTVPGWQDDRYRDLALASPYPTSKAEVPDDQVIVTGYKAARARKLTAGHKQANQILAAARAPVEHAFANLKAWRTLTKLRTESARATALLRALLVLTSLEVNR